MLCAAVSDHFRHDADLQIRVSEQPPSLLHAQIRQILNVFLSRLFAVREKCPVTVFLISGIFPLVPGAGIYWTAYYIVVNELELAGQRGFQTLKIAVAIVLSILLVFELPQGIFRVRFRKEKKTI